MILLCHFSDEKSEASHGGGVWEPRQDQDLNPGCLDPTLRLCGRGQGLSAFARMEAMVSSAVSTHLLTAPSQRPHLTIPHRRTCSVIATL